MKKIRVIIVDDSLLFREVLQQALEQDVNISVVGKAADPFEASKQIVELKPDLLIVDVHMDKMNGVDFVSQLLPQYYLPVIMVSSDAASREKAEAVGAVTFIDKPSDGSLMQSDSFFPLLLSRIRAIINKETFYPERMERIENKIIAIGASTGGAEAIETLLTALPAAMPPIVISQHMPAGFTKSFAERLNAECRLSVKEAADRDPVIPGQVYIAPGGFHMSLRSSKNKYSIHCDPNTAGSSVTPNVDVLLSSVAATAKAHAIGVLLTGMGRDGAEGLRAMRLAGAYTIGQDAASSVVYGMPKAAFDIGAVKTQLPLQQIAKKLMDLAWS